MHQNLRKISDFMDFHRNVHFSRKIANFLVTVCTSSSAIAEGPGDALDHLKSCQLLHDCTKITFD